MMDASITPGMARTRFSRWSGSMIRPHNPKQIRSERRGAAIGAGLGVPHFPRGPPGTTGPGEDPDLSADYLNSEDLMTSGDCLPRRKAEELSGRTPDLDLLSVLVPESR